MATRLVLANLASPELEKAARALTCSSPAESCWTQSI